MVHLPADAEQLKAESFWSITASYSCPVLFVCVVKPLLVSFASTDRMLPGPVHGSGPLISTVKPAGINRAPASTVVVTSDRLFVVSGSKESDAHRNVAV